MSDDEKAKKIKSDYEGFLSARAALIVRAVEKLANGEDVSVSEILKA